MPKVIDVNVYNKRAFRYFSKKQIQAWLLKIILNIKHIYYQNKV